MNAMEQIKRVKGWNGIKTGLACAGLCLLVNTVSAATPLLDFEFNEGKGLTTADSANNLIGTFGYGTVASDTNSPAATANDKSVSLNFGNATSQGFLAVDDSNNPLMAFATNQAFTMEAWVYMDPTDLRQFEGIGAYGSSYKMGLNAGQLLFTLFGIVDIPSGLFVPLDSAWHHVASVWEPGVGVTFYLDGTPAVVAETRVPRAYQNNFLTIGAEGITGNAIQGSIDRFRVHKAALTAADIDSDSKNPKAPLASTVVAYNFNESAPPYASAVTPARPAYDFSLPTWINDTPSGKTNDFALNFATGKFVTVNDPDLKVALDQTDPSFTVQAWVKFSGLPATRMVLFFNNGPGGAISFSINNDRTVFVTTLGILDANSTAVVPDDGAWHHVAVVHENGKELRYYVDGILGYTRAYTSGVIFTRTQTFFTLGSEPGGGLQYSGSLDRLKVTSGMLTPGQLDFWPIPGVQPGSPSLSIATVELISWPTTPAGYKLQSSTDLHDPKTWTDVTNTPSLGGGKYFVLVPPTQNQVFYRLFKP
jgi:hypothetical protein